MCVASSIAIIAVKKSITCYECVSLTLGKQHVKHMHRIILSSVASLAPYIFFFSFSYKQHNFLEKLMNIKCDFLFSLQIFQSKQNSAR